MTQREEFQETDCSLTLSQSAVYLTFKVVQNFSNPDHNRTNDTHLECAN